MYRSRQKHSARARGLAIATISIAAISATIGSCVFGTKTNLCEKFDLRCEEGQECATDQPVCISIGGCGNHHMDPGEVCDDGNTLDGDGCSANCLSKEICGNGITDSNAKIPEECDDGPLNGTPNDPCDSQCHIRKLFCGNGMVDQDKGEECDPGPMDSADCNSSMAGAASCKASKCGDGYTNMVAGESCDTGSDRLDAPDCNGTLCTRPTCGDNYVNIAAGEECDDSHGVNSSTCNGSAAGSASCHSAECGDGYVNSKFTPSGGGAPEECDNLGGGDTTACNGNNHGNNGPGSCRLHPTCGDGYTNTAIREQCDNPGGSDTDTCNGSAAGSASCHSAECGDGHVNSKFTPSGGDAPEQCDNPGGGDTSNCNGNNHGNNGSGSCRFSRCGDSYTNTMAGETCDGGVDDTLMCNGTSAPKTPKNLRCQLAVCGDNYVNTAGEKCDNSNGVDTNICNGNKAGGVSCQIPTCGDGYVNKAAGEECEGNNDCTDSATPHCDTKCHCVAPP